VDATRLLPAFSVAAACTFSWPVTKTGQIALMYVKTAPMVLFSVSAAVSA
jgi:hypothetical protein